MEDDSPQKAQKWLEDLATGSAGHEIETLSLGGMQVSHAHKGLIRCNFVIPKHLSDQDGNWHVGAIATLVDDVGAAAIYSTVGHIKASVSFNISYYSTPKIQEEVEIEAKVVGQKGKLASVVVEIRRKDNGRIVALGKQWMTSSKIVPGTYQNKTLTSQVSKL
ncbi:hypothetical protein L1049_005485 [Liquidambar formosana]|uniref:Acyl-coenzyme A thioesterase 13 n=1 Tax=Liquidambar formosana TaxID=63359 RepID=A0AAP0WWL5_LIQFO